MSIIAEATYAPLDEATYKHQALLLRSLHCARPVKVHGRDQFIHTLSTSQAGGRIEMTVYLAGAADPVPSESVVVDR